MDQAQILVICANENLIADITGFLRRHEDLIVIARTLAEARELYLDHFPTLRIIFTDIKMPDDNDDDRILYFVNQIVESDWDGLLMALTEKDFDAQMLMIHGCRGAHSRRMMQSHIYVYRQYLRLPS